VLSLASWRKSYNRSNFSRACLYKSFRITRDYLRPVHTKSDKSENVLSFLRLGTLIRHENGALENAFQIVSKTELFENNGHDNLVDFLVWFSSKMIGNCCIFKFLRFSVDGKICWVFRVKSLFSYFSDRRFCFHSQLITLNSHVFYFAVMNMITKIEILTRDGSFLRQRHSLNWATSVSIFCQTYNQHVVEA